MASEPAIRDGNFVTTALFEKDGAPGEVMPGQIDEATGRILVDLAGGSGTVTSVSVVSANGFAGTVANATTTPAITLTTTINSPVLAGNGTAISAATTTGSGSTVVLATSPTLVTPVLGAATATSINGLTITNSTGTLTVTNGKTINIAKSLTLDGTDSTTMTFPSTNATIARTDAGQTFTGVNTFTSPKIITDISDTNGNEVFKITATGSAVNEITVANAATGGSPQLSATGGDTDIGIDLLAKGAAAVNIKGNSTQAGEIRIYEDTDDGTNFSAFRGSARSSSITYTLPTSDPTAGQVLSAGTPSGNVSALSWASAGGGVKELFIPISFRGTGTAAIAYSQVTGSWPNGNIDSTQLVAFTFRVPSDFTSVSQMKIVMIPDASETITWDCYGTYAAAGEDYDLNENNDVNRSLAVTDKDITEADIYQGGIATLFAGLAANDYVGVQFQSDTSDLRILGLKFIYT